VKFRHPALGRSGTLVITENGHVDELWHQFFSMPKHRRAAWAHAQCAQTRRMSQRGGFDQQKPARQRRGRFSGHL
jgi:hypothetical protein